MLPTNFEKF